MTIPVAHANTLYWVKFNDEDVSPLPKSQQINQMFLFGLIMRDFFITQPITLAIEEDDDGTVIVSDELFLVYGFGGDINQALDDYIQSLIEYYNILKSSSKEYALDVEQFDFIQSYIKPIY